MKTKSQLFCSTQILLYSYITFLGESQSPVGRGPEFHKNHFKYPLPGDQFSLISFV